MRLKHLITTAILSATLLLSPFSFGKGSTFGGGGGRSSSPSFGGGYKSAPAPSAKSSYTSSNSSGTGKVSATDRAIAQKSAISPTASRQQAVEQFKAQNATKYTTRFDREPATRPSYIPRDYYGPGNTYHYVYYNPGYGGYGYWLGAQWIMYDALSTHANLYADSQPVYYGGDGGGGHVGRLIVIIFSLVFLVILIAVIYNVTRPSSRY